MKFETAATLFFIGVLMLFISIVILTMNGSMCNCEKTKEPTMQERIENIEKLLKEHNQ